ncbi:hypothetical protein FALBO_1376 [Fusarium albosuccineum]|uniref:Phytanoyl-CoA dioxygenase n=1 Tax=Fusarium albosuccineum TaxID=1237068 RepID=A0A8H4PDM6_9HYPO|nr:hypothetical protein FALBO_1376 [Fusarium albosuccineum]
MAASGSDSSEDVFGLTQVASLITAENSPQFLQEHGFFYQEIPDIGKLVTDLYSTNRAKGKEATLDRFKPTLCTDPRLQRILDYYPETGRLQSPWGIVPKAYYSWDNPRPEADNAIIAYMLGPESQFKCKDGSHRRKFRVEKVDEDGTRHLPDEFMEEYRERSVKMTEGGVLLVHPVLAHRTETGRSIILDAWTTHGAKSQVFVRNPAKEPIEK